MKQNKPCPTPGGCNPYIQGKCVLYSGLTIPLFNIVNGDTMDLAFNKIYQYVNTLHLTETDPVWNAEKSLYYTKINLQTPGGSMVHWDNIIGEPSFLTSFTETDPIFTGHVASSITSTDLTNWNLAYNKSVVSLAFSGTNTKTLTLTLRDGSTISNTFIDLQALASVVNAYSTVSDGTTTASAVGSDNLKFRSANNLLSVTVGNNTPVHGDNVLLTVSKSGIEALVKEIRARFTVGDAGMPQDGDTSFILKDSLGNPIINRNISFFRERALQVSKNNRDYTYNPSTGLITLTVPFKFQEDCEFFCKLLTIIDDFESVPSVSVGFDFILPYLLS